MSKDIILFVNAVRPATIAALEAFQAETGRVFEPLVIVDKRIQATIDEVNGQANLSKPITTLVVDFDSTHDIRAALTPYIDRLFAVTAQYENCITELQKLVPYVPYLPMPSERSLDWATEKKLMRKILEAFDASLVPGYMEVHDASDKTIAAVEKALHYPVMVKPSGLGGSWLVTMAQNREDLQLTLDHVFATIQSGYDNEVRRRKPAVLVEEFMEGDMYSVDTYIAPDGTCRHTPPVRVITGRKVGFDDFFGYVRLAPSGLDQTQIALAQQTAEKACKALCLRSVTAHVELMKTPHGWKVIELGPRIGGYRHDIYHLSYGINHIMNDIRNRAGEEPTIPTEVRQHTAVMYVYGKNEGILTATHGLENVRKLSSLVSIVQTWQVGDTVRFAKNAGDPVFTITLSSADEAQLQKDIATIEQTLVLDVRPMSRVPVAK